ncbi:MULTISPECIES: hypothetical protein [Burkholderia cepacia complex]|uniref:hypothetical protein n=1 Tax=Burkholderia cepacia complex TaxID=87882 RepID=UPI000BA5CD2E|nr:MULTISPECIES: hypothetical protein [Burkholderia cepacia complex]PAK13984.1 hypothetical protein CJO66_13565 [Burkholderia ubonensis]RQQ00159.1 hypothetical protein DF009_01945 [Burkholderia ubonensis]RQQ49142.1 hypothetical protein DF145_16140 [Burkholderia stagnalis]RQY00048.1 hypothetical protein DF121_16330 [Burkholderia stagnalis]RQY14521.1 hypothetical protein DF115_19235 [Burkholderia stagnalis]
MSFPLLLSRGQCFAAVIGAAATGAIAAGAVAFFGGYYTGSLAGNAKIAALEHQYADAARAAIEQARAKEHAEAQRAAVLAGDLFAEKARHALESDELKRRIASVTTQYRPAPDAPLQALPRCVFTGGFVRVWNAAAGPDGVSAADPSAGAAAPAVADDALDSGVRQDDVLAHHVDAARRSRDIESQLNKLIDLIEGDTR